MSHPCLPGCKVRPCAVRNGWRTGRGFARCQQDRPNSPSKREGSHAVDHFHWSYHHVWDYRAANTNDLQSNTGAFQKDGHFPIKHGRLFITHGRPQPTGPKTAASPGEAAGSRGCTRTGCTTGEAVLRARASCGGYSWKRMQPAAQKGKCAQWIARGPGTPRWVKVCCG